MGTTHTPPIFTIVANVLASSRARCYSQAQLILLDQVIDALVDDLDQASTRFDTERFKKIAKYGYWVSPSD